MLRLDERDENLEEEDADLDDENSDDDEEEEDAEEDDDDESDESEDDDESDDEEDEDNKPVTRKELRDALKSTSKNRNAKRRVDSKKAAITKKPSETDKRIAELEKSNAQRLVLEKKLDFASEHKLSKKQVDHVFRLTKRPTAKFLNKPHVKAALDAIKSQEGVRNNTPSGSGKRGKTNGGDKKWTELPAEERQSNFADRRRNILANKR